MKKVLIGAVRSKGDFKDGKKKIKYDNIKLYLANYREYHDHGFTFDKNVEPVKIRTADFFEVVGISHQEFLKNFQRKYMFHRVRVIGEENDYGRTDVIEVKISVKDCFTLYKELKEEKENSDYSEEDEDDSEELDEGEELDDYSEEELDEDEEEESFDDFNLDTDTGEVKENVKETKKK